MFSWVTSAALVRDPARSCLHPLPQKAGPRFAPIGSHWRYQKAAAGLRIGDGFPKRRAMIRKPARWNVTVRRKERAKLAVVRSRRVGLARSHVVSSRLFGPCRFRQSGGFLDSTAPDDPRGERRITPSERLRDGFFVVERIQVHKGGWYPANIDHRLRQVINTRLKSKPFARVGHANEKLGRRAGWIANIF